MPDELVLEFRLLGLKSQTWRIVDFQELDSCDGAVFLKAHGYLHSAAVAVIGKGSDDIAQLIAAAVYCL